MYNYLLFILIYMSFSAQSWAMKYSCEINIAPPDTQITEDKIDQYICDGAAEDNTDGERAE